LVQNSAANLSAVSSVSFNPHVLLHVSRERQRKAKDRAERREMCMLEVMETEKSYVEVRAAFLGSDHAKV
jgi:hypothetical protein